VAGFCGRRAPTHRESRGTIFGGRASLTWRDKWQMVWASRSSGADASERPSDDNVMSTNGLPQAAFRLFILARRAMSNSLKKAPRYGKRDKLRLLVPPSRVQWSRDKFSSVAAM
jgi:hypothetical protein